jgi:hypothetical protein
MEGDGSGHFLLDQIQTVLGGLVLVAAHVDIEVVFVKSVKDNLYVAFLIVRDPFAKVFEPRGNSLWPMILLILPFFLPLTNSLCSLASSILTRIWYWLRVTKGIWLTTVMAALTASSDPLIVNVRLSKLTSASELVQMSESIDRTSGVEGARTPPWEGSGMMIHHEAL